MVEVFLFFFYLFSIAAFFYGYYRLCKWLTYNFFDDTPEKTGDWIKDYVVVYTKKLLGVILLLPVSIIFIVALIAASSKSSGSKSFSRSRYSSYSDEEYVIQYRRGSSWIDGPGSNDERVAESMFDQFLDNDPRSFNRCRLVHKINGRVQSVLSTN